MRKEKIIYYSDELNDDFAGIKERKPVQIDKSFNFLPRSKAYKIGAIFIYRLIMLPVAFIYCKIKFKLKLIGKEKLKKIKGGYFLYGNHTQIPGDGYIHNMVNYPQKSYVLINPEGIAKKGTKTFMQMVGAIPIFTTLEAAKPFSKAIEEVVETNPLVIYPEAHIWPYYTGIRNFKDVSFKYPVKFNKPCFCFTVTYQKRRYSTKPKMTVFIDGPFYPDNAINAKDAKIKLRNEIFYTMKKNSEQSTYSYIKYIKKNDRSE